MKRFALALAAAAAAFAWPAHGQSDIDRWNLADLYADVAAWKADAGRVEAQLHELEACKGRLAQSAARFKACMDLRFDAGKRVARLSVYASELYSGDTGQASSLELQQNAQRLESRLGEATAFFDPEIVKLGRAGIERYLKQQPTLAIYRYPLEQVLRQAPHTHDAAGETLLAQFGLAEGTGGAVYSVLTNADIPWPTIKLSTGEDATLDTTGYTKWREAPARDDRKRVMDAFFGTFHTFERTLGVTYYGQLKEDLVRSKVRRYPDSVTRALDADNIPVAVMDTLVAQANATLPTLHRYFKLRARILGVPQLAYYDIYPPLVHSGRKYPLEEAKQLTLAAVAPLGRDYVDAMGKGFSSRWMDTYPRPRKESGAHMNGSAVDVHPLVLMNYNDDYESVSTLAHEWGHAMHSYYANRAQPFATAGYATFTAEIASTVNEVLLLEHMLKVAKDDDERLTYLGSALENLRGTFYRQAMFGEFERQVHAKVDGGASMTGEAFTKDYCDILKRYHGADKGVVAIDDAYCVEWAYIPHFYNSFYVYQYATSVSAASLFARKILAKEPGALERYRAMLAAGGSGFPYELVKRAGVDLASPAPYRAVAAEMDEIMDRIEAILAKRPAAPHVR